jgi:hypothetical protein
MKKSEENLPVLVSLIEDLNKWAKEAENRARSSKERPYDWGFADGMNMALKIAIAAYGKAEREIQTQLAQ